MMAKMSKEKNVNSMILEFSIWGKKITAQVHERPQIILLQIAISYLLFGLATRFIYWVFVFFGRLSGIFLLLVVFGRLGEESGSGG